MHRFCIYILDRKNSSLWCVVGHRIYKKKEEKISIKVCPTQIWSKLCHSKFTYTRCDCESF